MLSSILTVPALFNETAYLAVTSVAVIGLYIAYVAPVLLRRLRGDDFKAGPWNLGRWSAVIGWIAVVWVIFICILFVLPPTLPITISTFNYSPIAVLAVLVLSIVLWYARGKKHFMRHLDKEQLARDEKELLDEIDD